MCSLLIKPPALLLFLLIGWAFAEEESIMSKAKVYTYYLDLAKSQGSQALIDKSFNTVTQTQPTTTAIRIEFENRLRLKSALFVNNDDTNQDIKRVNGKLSFTATRWIDPGSVYDQPCADNILDTSFIPLTCSDSERYYWLERKQPVNGISLQYLRLNELRLYQTPNLLKHKEGVTVTAPAPINPAFSADNLLNNLSSRSSSSTQNALIDTAGNTASFNSCYKPSSTNFEGKKLIITFDLQETFFQHAIVVVQDLATASIDGQSRLKKFEVHVGESNAYIKNTKCTGGPFMDPGNPSSSKTYTDSQGNSQTEWNYGEEIWCNLQGRYTTIVADYSDKSNDFNVSICNFAIMGTKYVRTTAIDPPNASVVEKTFGYLYLPKITVDPSYEISNNLNICARSPGQAWLVFNCNHSAEKILITMDAKNKAVGSYSIVIETYDANSIAKSTLWTDVITITVTPFDCASPPAPAFDYAQTLRVVEFYEPTILYPKAFFMYPLTAELSSLACTGTYSQSISVKAKDASDQEEVERIVTVVTKQANDADRSSITIGRTDQKEVEFVLTFKATYTPTGIGQPTTWEETFDQTYRIYTMMEFIQRVDVPSAYHNFEVDASSDGKFLLEMSDLTFTYTWHSEAGLSRFKNRDPGPVSHGSGSDAYWLPYASFTEADITLGNDVDMKTEPISLPGKFSASIGAIGEEIQFCSEMSQYNMGQTYTNISELFGHDLSTLFFRIYSKCSYLEVKPPEFIGAVPDIIVTVGKAETWALPEIEMDSAGEVVFGFTQDDKTNPYCQLDKVAKTLSYNGDTSVIALSDQEFIITVTLNNKFMQSTEYKLKFSVPCPITDTLSEAAVKYLEDQKVELSVMAPLELSVGTDYKKFFEKLEEILHYDADAKKSCNAEIAMNLVSGYEFLEHEIGKKSVVLTSDVKQVISAYSEAYIEFSLYTWTWKLKIQANFVQCELTSLKFESPAAQLTYKVGSGDQVIQLTGVLQKPACLIEFSTYSVKSIVSGLDNDLAASAFIYDNEKKQIIVNTQDAKVAKATIEITIAVEQTAFAGAEDFVATIDFLGGSVIFDMSEFAPLPITCSPKDAQWSTELPPLIGEGSELVEIALSNDKVSKSFKLNDGLLTLKPKTLVSMTQSIDCPEGDSIEVSIFLKSELNGDSSKKIQIPLDIKKSETEDETEDEADSIPIFVPPQIEFKKKEREVIIYTPREDEEEVEKLSVSKVNVSPTSEVTLKFSKAILPIASLKARLRSLELSQEEKQRLLTDAITFVIDDNDEDAILQKSIVAIEFTKSTDTSVSFQLTFYNSKAISQQVSEPDTLLLRIMLPQLFIDAETGEPLGTEPIDLFIQLGVQYTKEEFVAVVKKASTAVQMGVAFSLWEIVLIILFKKVLFSMWILILTLQFFVYISLWQVRYPSTLHFIMYELKKIALGEFMDDIDLSGDMMAMIGIETEKKDSTVEAVSEERLGSQNALASFGPTLIIGSIFFVLLIVIIVIGIILIRRIQCSEKNRARVKNLKQKVFFNPIIRYLVLNSLKLNMSGIIAIKAVVLAVGAEATETNLTVGISIITMINITPIVFAIAIQCKRGKLEEPDALKAFGAMYYGKNVTDINHWAGLHPLAFFWRRCGFICATIYLFDYPILQMYAHHLLTMLLIVTLVYNNRTFVGKDQAIVEVGSEFLLHLTSIFLSQFMVADYDFEMQEKIELCTLGSFGLLVLLNIIFITHTSISDCREKRRTKAMEARKKAYKIIAKEKEEKAKAKEEIAEQKRLADLPLSVIQEEELGQNSSKISYLNSYRSMEPQNDSEKKLVESQAHSAQQVQLIAMTERITNKNEVKEGEVGPPKHIKIIDISALDISADLDNLQSEASAKNVPRIGHQNSLQLIEALFRTPQEMQARQPKTQDDVSSMHMSHVSDYQYEERKGHREDPAESDCEAQRPAAAKEDKEPHTFDFCEAQEPEQKRKEKEDDNTTPYWM